MINPHVYCPKHTQTSAETVLVDDFSGLSSERSGMIIVPQTRLKQRHGYIWL